LCDFIFFRTGRKLPCGPLPHPLVRREVPAPALREAPRENGCHAATPNRGELDDPEHHQHPQAARHAERHDQIMGRKRTGEGPAKEGAATTAAIDRQCR